ncbi:MAG: hypothetical protein ABSB96_00080 [Gaiellaceae bacterium]
MAVAAFAVSTGELSGCGTTEKKGDHLYIGNGVSFRFPHNWKKIKPQGSEGRGLWTVMVAPPDSSGADVAFMTEYRIPRTITKKNLASKKAGITSTVAGVALQAGGALLSGPTPITMGGLPGYRFRISARVKSRPSTSRLVLVWKGRTEYFLNCQYLTKGILGSEIERGCRMIIASFKLG